MKLIQPESSGLGALNTKPIGYLGLGLAALGMFGPFFFLHASPDLHDALRNFGALLVTLGTGAAYVGRPVSVKSNAPANPADVPTFSSVG